MNDQTRSQQWDWKVLRTLDGSARYIPEAIHAMMSSATPEAAELAYWRLDNNVVVQGQLFEAAEAVAAQVINRICDQRYSGPGLPAALDLLVELAYGEADESEKALGNTEIGMQCRIQIANRLDCIKSLIQSKDERVLLGVLDLVDLLDQDEYTRHAFLLSLPTPGWPEAVLKRLQEMETMD